MSETPNTVDTVVLFLRVPSAIKEDLEALAIESGKSSLNAFLLPYLNAVRRGDMRMVTEVASEKLLTGKQCGGCQK